jgi:D-tyrosyl-tRNA(Tyr) deacylase
MRAVIQRVDGASVSVDGKVVGAFEGYGLMVLIGVSTEDSPDKCALLADKIWKLRIFESQRLRDRGVVVSSESNEVSAADANLPILAISQFTLFADTTKGRRPTWNGAARGDVAEPMVEQVVAELRALGATVATGRFGAYMSISQICDGPTTIVLEV